MRIFIVASLANILSGIKLNRVSDKETKTILVKDYLQLKSIVHKAEENKQELIKKFQDDWKEEIPKISALRKDNKPVEGFDEYLEAEADALKMINESFAEDVEVSLVPVDLDKFINAVGEEELTLEAIAFLQENGVVV